MNKSGPVQALKKLFFIQIRTCCITSIVIRQPLITIDYPVVVRCPLIELSVDFKLPLITLELSSCCQMSPCIDYLRVALMLSDSHHLLPLSCPVASDGLVCNGMVQIHSEQTSLKFCSLSYWQMCVSLIQPSLDPIIIKRKKKSYFKERNILHSRYH